MGQQQSEVRVEYLGKKILPLSKQIERVGYFYELSLTPSQQQPVCHHVVLVDLSWSMKSELTWIKKSLKALLKQLKQTKNQALSILGFADKMTSYWLIRDMKSEEISEKIEELEQKIDRLVSVCSIGQFSAALLSVIDQLNIMELNYPSQQLIILTDANWYTMDHDFLEELKKGRDLLATYQKLFSAIHFLLFHHYHLYSALWELIHAVGTGSVKEALTQTICLQQMRKWVKGDSSIIQVKNESLFSLSNHRGYKQHELLEIGSQGPHIVVTFDKPLKQKKDLINVKDLVVGEEIFHQFRLSYALHLMRNNKVDDATYQLEHISTLDLYERVRNGYTVFERNQSLSSLLKAVSKPNPKKGSNEVIELVEESLCLLEVIYLIQKDEKARLWWNPVFEADQPQKEGRYQFKPYHHLPAQVCQIQIGSKKFNIGLKVKIEGYVEDQVTGLKLEAHVFKTIPLLVNGKMMMKEIGCRVSKELKRIFQQEHLIKARLKWNEQEILILNLAKLKVVNCRMETLMGEETIASSLYEIEDLGCKRLVLKSLINQMLALKSSKPPSNRLGQDIRRKTRRQYGINESGMYLSQDYSLVNHQFPLGHYVPVIEWKIEGFKKQQALKKAYETYMVLVNNQEDSFLKRLFNELDQVSRKRQQLLDLVHLQRIALGLIPKMLDSWEQEFEKPKMQMDPVLKRNVIYGGKMIVSRKQIDQITLRQNAYTVWVRQQALD